MKKIKLTQGKYALVDDEDFDKLIKLKWCANKSGNTYYAKTWNSIKKNNDSMHRIILGVYDSKIKIDHEDGNGLNNQKSNIRICTNKENLRNRRKQKKECQSKYKGVRLNKNKKRWRVQIKVNGKIICLGTFDKEKEAAKRYDLEAIKLFGEYANLNFKKK